PVPQEPASKMPAIASTVSQERPGSRAADHLPTPKPASRAAGDAVAATPPTPRLTIRRRSLRTDEELRKQLLLVPEVGHNSLTAQARRFLASAPKNKRFAPEELPDFAGLPMRMGLDCQLGKENAESLQVLSRKMRTLIGEGTPRDDVRPDASLIRKKLIEKPD